MFVLSSNMFKKGCTGTTKYSSKGSVEMLKNTKFYYLVEPNKCLKIKPIIIGKVTGESVEFSTGNIAPSFDNIDNKSQTTSMMMQQSSKAQVEYYIKDNMELVKLMLQELSNVPWGNIYSNLQIVANISDTYENNIIPHNVVELVIGLYNEMNAWKHKPPLELSINPNTFVKIMGNGAKAKENVLSLLNYIIATIIVASYQNIIMRNAMASSLNSLRERIIAANKTRVYDFIKDFDLDLRRLIPEVKKIDMYYYNIAKNIFDMLSRSLGLRPLAPIAPPLSTSFGKRRRSQRRRQRRKSRKSKRKRRRSKKKKKKNV